MSRETVFFLGCGTAKPIHETRRAKAGFSSRSRDEALIVQLCAKVASVDISVHFSCVSGCAQELADELIHSDRFGTGNLDRTVYWLGDCDVSQGGGDIIRRDGLHESRRQPNRLPFSGRLRDALRELEELGRANDRKRNLGGLDDVFFSHLCTQITTRRKTIGADD